MPSLKDKENELKISELEPLSLIEMGFFSDLKRKKIRFNLRPFSKSNHRSIKKANIVEENLVDLHLETIKKVDELLERHEKKLQLKEPEPVSKIQQVLPLTEVVEIREPSIRKPELPYLKTEIGPKNVSGELSQDEEFFEVEIPTEISSNDESKQVNDDDLHNWMLGGQDKKYQKSFMGSGRIIIGNKNKTSNQKAANTEKTKKKTNDFTKTKIELEKTKNEIEEKKRALGEAIEKEKEKEKELMREKEEKIKQEKLKRMELKKKIKKQKLKEKETKKAELQREKELEKLEKKKLEEEKLKAKETEKAEKQKEKELKKLEKKKLEEEKLKAKETEKAEKQKEKELKKLEKKKLEEEKLMAKETEKAEEQEEKELKRLEKEKLEEKKRKEKLKEKKELEEEKLKSKESRKKDAIKTKKEKEDEPPGLDEVIKEEEEIRDEKTLLDDDVEKLLPILDELLEKLPDEVVDEFAQSENFVLYEKVVSKYKRK